MEEEKLNLCYPPIVEAVLDIECDLPPNQQISSIESDAKKCFHDQYPKFRAQFVQHHQIATKPGEQPEISVRQGVQAFQFLQEDEKQLVQVRVNGFSFNRLAPYTNLDDYLPEIERTWRIYVELSKPVQIKLIRLRYINRILIPLTEGKVDLDDFFKVGPHLPDEKNLRLASFVNQHVAVEIDTGYQINSVLTSQPSQGDKIPIIFDNGVLAVESEDPENWDWIQSQIKSLRDLKNRIFKNTLTEECLNLFQQQL